MAVENLMVVSGPLAGWDIQENALGNISAWAQGHGITPWHVGLGAVIGAIARESAVDGAIRGAALVALAEAAYFYLVR